MYMPQDERALSPSLSVASSSENHHSTQQRSHLHHPATSRRTALGLGRRSSPIKNLHPEPCFELQCRHVESSFKSFISLFSFFLSLYILVACVLMSPTDKRVPYIKKPKLERLKSCSFFLSPMHFSQTSKQRKGLGVAFCFLLVNFYFATVLTAAAATDAEVATRGLAWGVEERGRC